MISMKSFNCDTVLLLGLLVRAVLPDRACDVWQGVGSKSIHNCAKHLPASNAKTLCIPPINASHHSLKPTPLNSPP